MIGQVIRSMGFGKLPVFHRLPSHPRVPFGVGLRESRITPSAVTDFDGRAHGLVSDVEKSRGRTLTKSAYPSGRLWTSSP